MLTPGTLISSSSGQLVASTSEHVPLLVLQHATVGSEELLFAEEVTLLEPTELAGEEDVDVAEDATEEAGAEEVSGALEAEHGTQVMKPVLGSQEQHGGMTMVHKLA